MRVLVSNVQRTCFHDGPGIRTVVFSMGCSIRCPWCCNPENLTHELKYGKKRIWGKEYEPDDLIELIMRDFNYYESGGGVTFSGGEFLLHVEEFKTVLSRLKEKGINLCVETSLYADYADVEEALNFFDLFIVDFKILIKERAKAVINADSSVFFRNIELLHNKEYWARIPLCEETADENNIAIITNLLEKNPPQRIEIFKLHNLGISKYDDLSMDYSAYTYALSDDRISEIINKLSSVCKNVHYLKV